MNNQEYGSNEYEEYRVNRPYPILSASPSRSINYSDITSPLNHSGNYPGEPSPPKQPGSRSIQSQNESPVHSLCSSGPAPTSVFSPDKGCPPQIHVQAETPCPPSNRETPVPMGVVYMPMQVMSPRGQLQEHFSKLRVQQNGTPNLTYQQDYNNQGHNIQQQQQQQQMHFDNMAQYNQPSQTGIQHEAKNNYYSYNEMTTQQANIQSNQANYAPNGRVAVKIENEGNFDGFGKTQQIQDQQQHSQVDQQLHQQNQLQAQKQEQDQIQQQENNQKLQQSRSNLQQHVDENDHKKFSNKSAVTAHPQWHGYSSAQQHYIQPPSYSNHNLQVQNQHFLKPNTPSLNPYKVLPPVTPTHPQEDLLMPPGSAWSTFSGMSGLSPFPGLSPVGSTFVSPRHSARSGSRGFSAARKRTLSVSPLSMDFDISSLIRVSPNSLFFNNSRRSSLTGSPLPQIGMNDINGTYGHLGANLSPVNGNISRQLLLATPNSQMHHHDLPQTVGNANLCTTESGYHGGYQENGYFHPVAHYPSHFDGHSTFIARHHADIAEESITAQQFEDKTNQGDPKVTQSGSYPVPPPPYHQPHPPRNYNNEFQTHVEPPKENSTNPKEGGIWVCRWVDCNQVFQEQDELVKHIEKLHIDQRKGEEFTCYWLQCPREFKPFNARYKLLIHMRVHSGERPNKCTFEGCNKAFSRLENLKIHQRSHTGERPYVCQHSTCNKAFSNSSDRAKHQRTHQDTKPYACQVPGCNKRYTDPSSLRKHVKGGHAKEQSRKKMRNLDPLGGDGLGECLTIQPLHLKTHELNYHNNDQTSVSAHQRSNSAFGCQSSIFNQSGHPTDHAHSSMSLHPTLPAIPPQSYTSKPYTPRNHLNYPRTPSQNIDLNNLMPPPPNPPQLHHLAAENPHILIQQSGGQDPQQRLGNYLTPRPPASPRPTSRRSMVGGMQVQGYNENGTPQNQTNENINTAYQINVPGSGNPGRRLRVYSSNSNHIGPMTSLFDDVDGGGMSYEAVQRALSARSNSGNRAGLPPNSPFSVAANSDSNRSNKDSGRLLQLHTLDRTPSQMSMVYADGPM